MSKYTNTLNELQRDLEKGEEALKKKLSRLYDSEAKKLEKEIAYYYETYGKDNVLEYRDMMKKLTKEEATMLFEEMDNFFRLHPEYSALMPVRESIYKLNRLEGLQLSIMRQQLGLSSEEAALIGDHLLSYTISTYEGVSGLSLLISSTAGQPNRLGRRSLMIQTSRNGFWRTEKSLLAI